MNYYLILTLACLIPLSCLASDQKRELEYADAIEKTNALGKVVWLQAGNEQFFGIYTESENLENRGVAVILHNKGGHPDQRPLIHALRTLLPQHHYATLSIQMPLRELGAPNKDYYDLLPEAMARIKASIDYLSSTDTSNMILIGHGLGGLMALSAQNDLGDGINAIVTLSLPVPDTKAHKEQALAFIRQTKVPFLDLYGSLDVPQVTETASERRLAAKETPAYRQVRISDEGHLYWHDEGLIVKRVYSWLRRVLD